MFTIWGGCVTFQNPKKIVEIVDIVGEGGVFIINPGLALTVTLHYNSLPYSWPFYIAGFALTGRLHAAQGVDLGGIGWWGGPFKGEAMHNDHNEPKLMQLHHSHPNTCFARGNSGSLPLPFAIKHKQEEQLDKIKSRGMRDTGRKRLDSIGAKWIIPFFIQQWPI